MKILIAYASKTGTSREMCELLASLLPNHEVTLANLENETPDPADFDYTVFGAPVRMGKLHRAARAHLKQYGTSLAKTSHTLFLCCAFADQFENYLEMLYPAEILESADEAVYFGGELNVSRQRGLDKFLVRIMRSSIRDSEDDEAMLPGLLPEHVRLLADRLRQLS